MFYFAYGSNMLKCRLENQSKNGQKIGSVVDKGIARLPKHEIAFNKESTVNESGKANIIPNEKSEVLGVLYGLTDQQFYLLDEIEGGYRRCAVSIEWNSQIVKAETYFAKEISAREKLQPTKDYLAFLICGAKEHGFSEGYINFLGEKAHPPKN